MSEKTRIVHLITDLNTGGAETMLLRLLEHMDQERFENYVICLIQNGPIGEKIAALQIPVTSLGMKAGKLNPAGLFHLTSLLHKLHPHILQTWLYHADLLGLLAGRICGVPRVVWNIRSADMDMSKYRPLSGLTRRTCASLSPWPDAVIVNSRTGQLFHTQIGYHPKHWILIPNGISTDKFLPDALVHQSIREEFGVAPETFLAGTFARYDDTKDFPTLLAAARRTRERGADFHILLAGDNVDAENSELIELIAENGLNNIVHLLGRRDDIHRLAVALDSYISASYTEAFPNSIAEAMACAIPCVATNAGDSAEIIGETGFVTPTRNPQMLADAWEKMISLPVEIRHAMGQRARERIQTRYSIEAVTKNYENFYNEILT